MFYFREQEFETINAFADNKEKKAMAIYGRRRSGKTALILEYYNKVGQNRCVYYQCSSFLYKTCLDDFIRMIHAVIPGTELLDSMSSFKDVFLLLTKLDVNDYIFVIDEFPFLAKKNDNVVVEFQWIIDHGLGRNKIILLGSSLSFMKHQIGDREAPLYGRFDVAMEIKPFSFSEVHQLFPVFEDAVAVYARTGGVAKYVMLYLNETSIQDADEKMLFDPSGQLFTESEGLLMQELREVSTYISILRAIGTSEKEAGQISDKCAMDPRAIFPYLNKLKDLDVISVMENQFMDLRKKRYYISDLFFRFHYTFIEPNISMITALGKKSIPYILNELYDEYLGFVYEQIIRSECYNYGLTGKIPFMPITTGKWWGSISENGIWKESEIDLVAFDKKSVILGECKYRNKAIGKKEYELLKTKSSFVPVGDRDVYYLLAARNGFTDEVKEIKDPHLILVDKI